MCVSIPSDVEVDFDIQWGSKGMAIVRYIFQIILGLIFGLLSFASLSPLLASLPSNAGPIAGIICVGLVALAVAMSPNLRRAFGRSFLILGACVFLLPLSTMALSGTVVHQTVSAAGAADKGVTAAGGVIASGLMTGIAGIVGFVLGSVLLVIGLILSLGGRREVVVVNGRR
jgi:hypothetical protein